MIKNKNKLRKGLVFSLILSFLLVAAVGQVQAGRCERAFERCGMDAIMTLVTSGSTKAFLIYAGGCLIGYEWCLRYLEPLLKGG